METSDGGRFLIYNKYEQKRQLPGTSGGSVLLYPGEPRYVTAKVHFEDLWKDDDTSDIRLQELASELTRLAP